MNTTFVRAEDLADDPVAAAAYVARRTTDFEKLMRDLKWEFQTPRMIKADIYGNTVMHELKPNQLHAFPVWGEIFWDKPGTVGKEEPVIFMTLENFAAYVLAKWW